MTYPETFMAAAREAAAKHGGDIDQATAVAEAAIRSLPDFADWVNAFVTSAIRELVYDARHQMNVAMKRDTGYYGGPAKVKVGDSADIQKVYQSFYEYHIAGMQLGMLKGADLEGIAESEAARAEGHAFNARLCKKLREVVPDDKTVREAVPERKLREIFKKVQRENKAA